MILALLPQGDGRCTDFLDLRLVINGVPFLGLLGRHSPLALSKLLRQVRHFGYRDEDGLKRM